MTLSTGFDAVSLLQFLFLIVLPITIFLDFSSSTTVGAGGTVWRALGVTAWVILIVGYFGFAAKYAEQRFLRRLETLT